jgi:hypothetical protein
MPLDADTAALLVRLTARISAVLLVSSLLVAARRLRTGAWRRADVGLFVAFIVSHTVHFACVALLARATGGATIASRGGWLLNVVIAGFFYVACAWIVRAKMRSGRQWVTDASRRREIVPLTLLWIVFTQAYLVRWRESWAFAALAVALIVAIVSFFRASLRSNQSPAVVV